MSSLLKILYSRSLDAEVRDGCLSSTVKFKRLSPRVRPRNKYETDYNKQTEYLFYVLCARALFPA